MERLTLHFNVNTEVLVTVHSGGEKFYVNWGLFEVIRLTLHLNVNTEVLVTIHS